MDLSGIKMLLLFLITLSVLNGITSQVPPFSSTAEIFGAPQIYLALENNTDMVASILASIEKIADSQSQISTSFSQVVALLQVQNQQLQNMSTVINSLVSAIGNRLPSTEIVDNATGQPAVDAPTAADASTAAADAPTAPGTTRRTTTPTPVFRDCSDYASSGNPSGRYTITPKDGLSFDVYCDMDLHGNGWTVFQRRYAFTDFYRGWNQYVEGFGNIDGEFWLGLGKINQLTETGNWLLRIDLESYDDTRAYAEYQSFSIGGALTEYNLSIGEYSGTAGDSLSIHDGKQFSTRDRDNDGVSGFHCAQSRNGAWWYSNLGQCGNSNLNGVSLSSGLDALIGRWWYTWKELESLEKSMMKIRRIH